MLDVFFRDIRADYSKNSESTHIYTPNANMTTKPSIAHNQHTATPGLAWPYIQFCNLKRTMQ